MFYKVRKTREASSQMFLNLGAYWIQDIYKNCVADHHFNTLEEAEARRKELEAQAKPPATVVHAERKAIKESVPSRTAGMTPAPSRTRMFRP